MSSAATEAGVPEDPPKRLEDAQQDANVLRVQVVEATVEDLAQLLILETGEDELGTKRWLAETSRRWHLDAFENPNMCQLKVLLEGRVVGLVVLADSDGARGVIELRRLVVAADRRGQGLGRQILCWVVDSLQTFGARQVWLDVHADNERARRLYELEGFIHVPAVSATPSGTVSSDFAVMNRFLASVPATGSATQDGLK